MNYLLDTTQTVPTGVGFPLYGATHLLWLAASLFFILWSCLVYRRGRERTRTRMRLLYAALLFPSWVSLPFPNLMHIHSFTVHALLVAYPVMLCAGKDIRPEGRYIPKCILLLIVVAIPGIIVNLLCGSNFMFLMEADPGNPLYLFETALGNHLIGLPVLIAAVLLVMHTPLYLAKRLRKKR